MKSKHQKITLLLITLFILIWYGSSYLVYHNWLNHYHLPIQLIDPSGYWWSGATQHLLICYRKKCSLALSGVHWYLKKIQWKPFKLIWHIDANELNTAMEIELISFQNVIIPTMQLTMPAQRLSKDFFFGGVANIEIQKLQWLDKKLTGDINLTWQYAALPFISEKPLGTYIIRIQARRNQLNLFLSSLSPTGPLKITGHGQGGLFPLFMNLSVIASVAGNAQDYESLQTVLRLIGKIDEHNQSHISIRF